MTPLVQGCRVCPSAILSTASHVSPSLQILSSIVGFVWMIHVDVLWVRQPRGSSRLIAIVSAR